jgi:hypothetical protein
VEETVAVGEAGIVELVDDEGPELDLEERAAPRS